MSGKPKVSEQTLDEIRQKVAKKLNNWADRLQISYHTTADVRRFVGEQWQDGNGDWWEQKEGYREKKSKLQSARVPWWCPKCSKPMNNKLDDKFYYLRGWCFDCNVNFEGELRRIGEYEAFERRHMRANERAFLRDKIEEHLTYIREFKEPTIYFENGGFQKLADKTDFTELFETLMRDVDFMMDRLAEIDREEEREKKEAENVNVDA